MSLVLEPPVNALPGALAVSSEAERERAGRAPEADVLRGLACAAVVLVHVLGLALLKPGLIEGQGPARGFAPVLLHAAHLAYQLLLWATPVFAILSGFVLFWCYRTPPERAAFWRRRGAAVLVPFLAWSVVYWFVYPGRPADPLLWPAEFLLGNGHLYFVGVVVQFYAVFPWLARRGSERPLRSLLLPSLLLTTGYQAFFSYVRPSGPAAEWWPFAGSLLPAWLFYLVLGGVLAQERERLLPFLGRNRGAVLAAAIFGAACLAAELYWLQLVPNEYASRRPVVVLFTCCVLPALWLACAGLAKTGLYPLARRIAGWSYGIYLLHPLALHITHHSLPGVNGLLPRLSSYLIGCWLLTLLALHLLRQFPIGERLLGLSRKPAAVAVSRPF